MKRLLLIAAMLSALALAGIGPAKVKADGTGRQCLMRCETTCAVQAAVAANAAQLMGADGDQVYQSIYQSCMSICPCTLVAIPESH